jgi:hypothetical protein
MTLRYLFFLLISEPFYLTTTCNQFTSLLAHTQTCSMSQKGFSTFLCNFMKLPSSMNSVSSLMISLEMLPTHRELSTFINMYLRQGQGMLNLICATPSDKSDRHHICTFKADKGSCISSWDLQFHNTYSQCKSLDPSKAFITTQTELLPYWNFYVQKSVNLLFNHTRWSTLGCYWHDSATCFSCTREWPEWTRCPIMSWHY